MIFEINYSKINAYNFCHYLYKFIYIDKKYVKHNSKTSLGISIHRCLADYGKRKLDLRGLINSFEENWNNAGFSTPQEVMEYYEMGVDLIKKFYEYEKNTHSTIFSTDDFFEVALDSEFILKGTVDRVDKLEDGSYEIIDYKLAMDNKNVNMHRNDLQLLIYGYGISRKYSNRVSFVSYYYLNGPRKYRMEYNEDGEFINFIKEVSVKMRNCEFSKKGRCDICLAREGCPYK